VSARGFSSGSRREAFLICASILILVPLPFGSTSTLLQAFWAVLLGAVGLLVMFRGGVGSAAPVVIAASALCGAILVFVLAQALHLVDHTPLGIEALVPTPTGGAALAQGAMLASMPLVAIGLAFCLAAIAARPPGNLARLWDFCAATGTGFAILALLQHSLAPEWILWEEKRFYAASLTAPFVNRNTAAAYYGMIALISLARIAWISDESGHFRKLRTFGLAIVLVALFATVSRAGIVVFFIALLGLGLAYRRQLFAEVAPKWIWTISILLLVAGVPILAARLAQRLSVEGFLDGSRACVYGSTLRAIKDFLPWGTGLGWFEWVLPAYRDIECGISGIWETAHSFFLQGLLELGFPFVLFLAAFYGLAGMILARPTPSKEGSIVKLTAVVLLLGVSAHNLIDFSAQVFGFALPLSVILGSAAGFLARGAGARWI
jgi:hypothetical protein